MNTFKFEKASPVEYDAYYMLVLKPSTLSTVVDKDSTADPQVILVDVSMSQLSVQSYTSHVFNLRPDYLLLIEPFSLKYIFTVLTTKPQLDLGK